MRGIRVVSGMGQGSKGALAYPLDGCSVLRHTRDPGRPRGPVNEPESRKVID